MSDFFEIRNDVPAPKAYSVSGASAKVRATAGQLAVGQSFEVPLKLLKTSSVKTLVKSHGKTFDPVRRFTIRAVPGASRVWRTE